jgi:hypothetical protein
MLKHLARFMTASVVALVLGSQAGAQCFGSLFGLVELFSNADGSVHHGVGQRGRRGVSGSLRANGRGQRRFGATLLYVPSRHARHGFGLCWSAPKGSPISIS